MSAVALPAPRRRPPGWLRLLRPHYMPLSLGTGLVGAVVGADDPAAASLTIGLASCLFGYGLGQIMNDYVDRKADAINAPDRPLVSGEVNANAALAASVAASLALLVAALVVSPPLALWMLAAGPGHALYTLTKGIPVLGNLTNGVNVATLVLVGAAAAAPERSALDVPPEVWVNAGLMALVLTGFGMVTYFKDVPGDTAVGYRTFVVAMGPQRARLVPPLLPLAAVVLAAASGAADPATLGVQGSAGPAFWVLLALAAAAFGIGSKLLVASPEANAFSSLGWYTRGVVVYAFALGAAHEPLAFALGLIPTAILLELALSDALRDGRPATTPTGDD